MISKKDAVADDSTDFVLKHRVTGAAFLILFGVLFLPWLLGAPSEASKAANKSHSKTAEEVTQTEIEQELLAHADTQLLDEDLEIYVSKITPLDAAAKKQSEAAATENQPKDTAPEASVTTREEKVVVAPPIQKNPPKVDTPEVVTKQTEPMVEPAKPLVEVGWVVQVGVFTDSRGAAKVVADLQSKGFEPSTTVVDTNLGKSTGTRVWLGPYAQRVEAAKSKTFLKEKTGGDGFIRAYP